MTTVTFFFLTLFTWMVSSGTQLRVDQCTEFSQHGPDEESMGFSSGASYKNAVIHDKTKPTMTCERSAEMSVALDRILTQRRIKKDYALFPGVTLNGMLFNGCVNLLQRVKGTVIGEKQNMDVYKCEFQQLLVYFLSKTSCLLLTIEIKTDNHSTHLNYRSICPSSVLLRSVAHCPHIITLVLVDHWKTMECVCICKECNLEVKVLQGFLYRERGPAFPEFFISILSESQVSPMSSEESQKAYVRICYVKMPPNLYVPLCPKEAFLTQADGNKFTVYTGRVESVRPTDTSRWVTRFFLAAVLLLGIYMRRIKISPNRISPTHGNNSTMVMLFTMTLHYFSPSVTIYQPSEWSRIAVGTSFVVCLSCALRRTVHVLIACRAAHTVMTLFCTTQQQFRSLRFTVLFIRLTFSPPFPNKNVKHWFQDILVEGNVGSTPRSWAVLGHIELLATLYCVFVSLPSLLQSLLTKQNFLSVLLNVQLVTCLQNSRIPTEYVLVIKINRLI
ncbi:uncharacterized protein LOC122879491 [Siniperca chuatsi]|uniref:uncharacterized protein LOC122879491 n=1 Tax=Siniperca chuatsi TaxID=119488 RepID=UPI001CE1AA5F|nr:uncharacterized protein LOC122879491 [Siniperca chuatsi]